MEIYKKDKDGKLQETTLFDLLKEGFENEGFNTDCGRFNGGSGSWVGVIQNRKDKQITTNIELDDDGLVLAGISIYSADIKTFVDEENMIKMV